MIRVTKAFILLILLHSSMTFAFVEIESFHDVVKALDRLPGNSSISIVKIGKDKREWHGDQMHPLGSGFKLYVLAALEKRISSGFSDWNDKYPILDEFKSLPSGVLQDQEHGTLNSLYNLAEHMIKISDNTATDHLIHILGRSSVEEIVKKSGNRFYQKNMPFLLTNEMIKIKWACDQQVTKNYINAEEHDRREILEKVIKNIPLNAVGSNGLSIDEPTRIRDVEWFACVADLCEIMHQLKDKNSSQIFKILSQNTPFVVTSPQGFWKYAGFKGGNEPGVYTSTYLLQDHSDQWYALALAWHDEEHNLNGDTFFALNEKVIRALERGKIF